MKQYPILHYLDTLTNLTSVDYFWYMLPFAVPGFATFLVGISLGMLGLFRIRRKEKIGYYLSFSGTCIGFGTNGLLIALRAVIQDEQTLLEWNTLLYSIVLIIPPCSFYLIYYILEKKYRFLLFVVILSWASVFVALWGILQGSAFTGKFLYYSFGKFPIATVFLRQWGVIGALSFLFAGVPCYVHYLRRNSFHEMRFLVIGHTGLIVFLISNLPSFIGIPIFPFGVFSFIPMLILAYGVFNSDFRDLKELIFEKNGLFYFLNLIVGVVLFFLTIVVLFFFSPLDYEDRNWYPYLLVPLCSVFFVVLLGIFIGGVNPRKPLNQLGSLALYLYGFQLLGVIAVGFSASPLIGQRIQQLCFLLFSFAPAVQMRFSFLSLNRPLPKFIHILDAVCLLMSFLSMSPYFFNGIYQYPWGNGSGSGLAVRIFGIFGLTTVILTCREWLICRKNSITNPLGSFATLYISIGGLLIFGSIPATMGIGFYPLGNLNIIPTLILAYAIIRYGGETIRTESLRVSYYLLPFSFVIVLFLLSFVWNTLPEKANLSSRYLHILFSGIPLSLLGLLTSFILIRPIASRIDSTLESLTQAKELAELHKQEIDKLNQISNKVNSVSELTDVLTFIMFYLENEYKFREFWFLLKDENLEELTSFSFVSPIVPMESLEYLKKFRLPIEKDSIITSAYNSKKIEYRILDLENLSEIDREIKEKSQFQYFLIVPLLIFDEVIGILLLHGKSQEEIVESLLEKLQGFSAQVAGAVYNSKLFKQAREAREEADREKEKALVARFEAVLERQKSEKQKQEVESLNSLIKSLNEELDIKKIMKKVHFYINKNYNIPYYGLAIVDFSKEKAITVDALSPEHLSQEAKSQISSFSTDLKNVVGAHAYAFKAQKPFYPPRIRKSGMTPEESINRELTGLESLLIIPLILQNEPIGFLDLYSLDKMELTKEDITKLSILGEQLAGIIYGSNLLTQVQKEKEKANLAKEEAEKARQEADGLNELMKNINSVSSLIDIMSFIMYYLETEYNFKDFSLLLSENDKLKVFSFTSPRNGEEVKDYFASLEYSKSGLQGVFSEILENKKSIYVTKHEISQEDYIALDWIRKADFDYLFLLPLVIYDELIGILLLHSPIENFDLTEEIRFKLERFSDLIAGSVFNAKLLKKIEEAKEEADTERNKSEKLLLNILPKDVAKDLKEKGFAEPELFESVSVMFTDFKGFTQIAETLSPQELIKDLDACFVQFDKITERVGLEKLKTIGDSYMCAGGIPKRNTTHAIDCCLAALEIQAFMNMMKEIKEAQGFPYWELRLGIHSGSLVAGVIGERKFAYDVWGDTVNTASRMESSGTPGKINISFSTYERVKHLFECEYRGEVSAKNKGVVKMYYLNRIRPEFSKDEEGQIPNTNFWLVYSEKKGISDSLHLL